MQIAMCCDARVVAPSLRVPTNAMRMIIDGRAASMTRCDLGIQHSVDNTLSRGGRERCIPYKRGTHEIAGSMTNAS